MKRENIISFKLSKLAKDKMGELSSYLSWYNELGDLLGRIDLNKEGKTFTEAYPNEESFYGCAMKPEHKKEFKLKSYPAYKRSDVLDWLRVEHNIIVTVDCAIENDWWYQIKSAPGQKTNVYKTLDLIGDFKTYEDALEAGLYDALLSIKD